MLFRIYLILWVILLFGNTKSFASSLSEIPRGQVVDTIKCIEDRSQSYALYLPSFYTTDKRFPIIYIFEPGGRGKLPIQKYYQIAETYGFIMACSNNSRNGPNEIFRDAANAILIDTKTRFTIDTSRFYTMGFSGGSRAAISLALKLKNIKGVIACGAGFPDNRRCNELVNFTLVGIVGSHDMNYIEMKELEQELHKFKISYWFDYFNGEHKWPEKDRMEDAFLYLYFDAMRRNLIKTDSVFCNQYRQQQLDKINKTDACQKYVSYLKLKNFINKLTDTKIIDSEISKCLEESSVLLQIEMEKKYQQIEKEWFEKIGSAFKRMNDYPDLWWKSETNKLNKIIADSSDLNMSLIAKRLINMVYSNSFENYGIEENNFELNIRLMRIAELAKPLSPYPSYYLASIYAAQKKDSQALKMLKKAIDNGFSNVELLNKDTNFKHLKTDKKFLEIIAPISKQN